MWSVRCSTDSSNPRYFCGPCLRVVRWSRGACGDNGEPARIKTLRAKLLPRWQAMVRGLRVSDNPEQPGIFGKSGAEAEECRRAVLSNYSTAIEASVSSTTVWKVRHLPHKAFIHTMGLDLAANQK